jgi:hypothetical protein
MNYVKKKKKLVSLQPKSQDRETRRPGRAWWSGNPDFSAVLRYNEVSQYILLIAIPSTSQIMAAMYNTRTTAEALNNTWSGASQERRIISVYAEKGGVGEKETPFPVLPS